MLIAGLIAGGVAIGWLIYLAGPSRREPVYQGRGLSSWLKQLDDGEGMGIISSMFWSPTATPTQMEAAEAIRGMGTNALPILMRDIHLHPTRDSLRIRAEDSVNAVLRRFHKHIWFDETTELDRRRWRAAQGLAALGPLAEPAVPELQTLLFTNYYHSSIKDAAYVLAAVGPKGVAILTNAVNPTNDWSGMCAIWALGRHPEAGRNAIPFLIRATGSTDIGTACGAIQVLGLFHTDGERVVPALMKALSSPHAEVRRDAAEALGRFGPEAAPAIGALEALKNSPVTRNAAEEALRAIRPGGGSH